MINDQTVKLTQVWKWTCPYCEHVNYEDMSVAELTPDDFDDLKVEHGIYGAETGDFVTCPSVVECRGCLAELSAEANE